MESIKHKIFETIKKYKYALVVLLLGIGLMLLPSKSERKAEPEPISATQPAEEPVSNKLERILSQIQGAGKVSVVLTEAEGERIIYQTDSNLSNSEGNSQQQLDTVTVTDSDKRQTGLIVQTQPPVYRGAVVVSEGADQPAVKLALVNAVSNLTGLGASQITVLKMK